MPKISSLLAETVTIPVPDLGLTVTYRPGLLTPEMHDKTIDWLAEKRQPAAAARNLAVTLVSWDLTDDDGKPYPTDEKALRKLPVRIIFDVFSAIQDDLNPNVEKSKASAGSF